MAGIDMEAGEGDGDPEDQPVIEADEFAERRLLVDLLEEGFQLLLGNVGNDLPGAAGALRCRLFIRLLPILVHFTIRTCLCKV